MKLTCEQIAFIRAHRTEDIRQLALRGVDAAVLQQINGWQKAVVKLPEIAAREDWLYPVQLSMEQCSGEITARYKAEQMAACPHTDKPRVLCDLTGGFGIDCYYVGQHYDEVHYVERQEELCELARHNMPHVHVHHTDSVEYLRSMPHVDTILIDPARRDDCGRKVAGLKDCTPDLTEIHTLLCEKADTVLVKLSPMLDIHQALRELPEACEVHVVSVHNECKELLLVLRNSPRTERDAAKAGEARKVKVYCVNIPTDKTFEYELYL